MNPFVRWLITMTTTMHWLDECIDLPACNVPSEDSCAPSTCQPADSCLVYTTLWCNAQLRTAAAAAARVEDGPTTNKARVLLPHLATAHPYTTPPQRPPDASQRPPSIRIQLGFLSNNERTLFRPPLSSRRRRGGGGRR
eukprot:GHVU01149800.1.p2 GENE.GHVU01149800.1~~GHVU01149800.1.p2  ORF type:complete len:139 (-),score=14.44 GHVU01149800.1:161-577(-)